MAKVKNGDLYGCCVKKTPDFGGVRASTEMLGKQCYRAVVRDAKGKAIFLSIDTYRNRDLSSSVSESARYAASHFITYELKALGDVRYRDGDYEHKYKGPAPFYDPCRVIYRCRNGYWVIIADTYKSPTANVPRAILEQAKEMR